MIQDFDAWSSNRSETNNFSDLEGSTIGIEAAFYLHRLLSLPPAKEPLLSALGGYPFALRAHIENEIEILRGLQITPLFVFNGLDVGKKDRPFKASDDAARLNAEAWDLYHQHLAEKAVDTFGNSGKEAQEMPQAVNKWAESLGFAKPEDYYHLLQSILHTKKVDFQVAPYSAWGQVGEFCQERACSKLTYGSWRISREMATWTVLQAPLSYSCSKLIKSSRI